MANLPGGQILSGFGGHITATQIGAAPVRIDVGSWSLSNIHGLQECPHSGTMGAITRRRVFLDWIATVNIWYRADQAVEQYVRTGWGIALNLYLGSPEAWLGYGLPGQSYYSAPSAMLETCTTIDNTKDIIRQELVIKGNSLIHLLPQEQVPYDTYITELRKLGQVV